MKDTRQKKKRKLSLANSQNSLGTTEWHVNCVGEPRKLKAFVQKNMYSPLGNSDTAVFFL